ncbi:MAG: Fic family protein, partial [Chlamydiae bacterium]|nr:Fic family protein [Chlamydiota bacterium]
MAIFLLEWPYWWMGGALGLGDNKSLLLKQLGLESSPISLRDLLAKLGPDFKERSVRRWLQLLVCEGMVEKLGRRKSTKYIIVKRPQKVSDEVSGCFSSASLAAISIMKKPIFDRQPVTYNEEWLESYRPNHDYYFDEEMRSQLLSMGKRIEDQDPAGTYACKIFNRLLIDLSYNSSRLEGNTYSLLDTEKLLLHGDIAAGKLDEEKTMILNHKEAIRYLVDNASKLVINSNVIRTLHYLLSDGLVESSEAGKVRRFGVRIGGSTYIPYEDPKRLGLQLEKIVEKASYIQNPFEQSIFLL